MARPITWQDVAGPAQTPGLLLAANQAGRQVVEAFEGIGDSLRNVGDVTKKANTDAAVAAILNSQNPNAAASAVPKGWQFDPLAISQATNQRIAQLQAQDVAEAQLENARLQTQVAQAGLDDRIAVREGTSLALPYRDVIFAGKKPDIDRADPRWSSAAGQQAIKLIDDWTKEYNDTQFQKDQLALQRTAANAAAEQLRMAKAQDSARNMMAAWRLTPEGSSADAATLQRQARMFAEQAGAGTAFYAPLVAQYGADTARGLASTPELEAKAPDGITYKTAANAIVADSTQIEAEKLSALRQFDVAVEGAKAMAKNNYRDMAPGAIDQAFLDNNKAAGDGMLAPDWETDDVTDRRMNQQRLAKKEAAAYAKEWGLPYSKEATVLTPAQEANLVELTIGNVSVFDKNQDSDAAKSLRKQYIAYNLMGGDAGIAQRQASTAAGYDAKIAENAVLLRDVQAAAMKQGKLPTKAVATYGRTPEGQLREKTKEKPWDFVNRSLRDATK